jgi:hypothetical protein
MRARCLMGYQQVRGGAWKKDKDSSRPEGTVTLHPRDINYFKFEISSLGAKSILEFGPGDSTQIFADLGLQVTTVEHSEKWYEVAKERFKDYPNVRVLKGEDEMPFIIHGMGAYEKFDLAFVDAPEGYPPRRKIHKGYEDCSRINTCLAALERAPVVLLHDVVRGLERGTLNRLNRLGYKIEIIHVPYGMARITHGEQNRPDPPHAAEPGSPPAGPKPKRRRQPKHKRSD